MATNFMFDTRDHKFVLKEWLDLQKLFSFDDFKDYYTLDDIDFYLDLTHKMCKEVLAPTNDESEEITTRFVDGKVITPPSFKEAYEKLLEAGLGPQFADRETEGKLPLVMAGINSEMMMATSPSLILLIGLGAGASNVVQKYADEKWKNLFLPKMLSGEWGGTMNLTEPGAGSDVGDLLSRAYPTETPGIYKIRGTKQFISYGDHDLTENIIHLVLARIEGCREGTSGISLFMVPKYWVNDDGSLGEFNDITTVGIEHKMGMKGSPTCTLSFGDNNACRGALLGPPPGEDGKGQGMMMMFDMMNEERMNVGVACLGEASNAYHNSVQYAKERIQGRPITNLKGPRVQLIKHEDIRRMLMYQKSCIEAIRAMVYKTYYYLDLAHDSPDEKEREYADFMAQINTPLCKAYSSDMAWKIIAEAIQVYGGYGYTEDYPVAQMARDCKIHSIWEGTNYIQAMDLLARKMMMGKGKPFMNWLMEIGQFIEANKNDAVFKQEFATLERAFQAYQVILGSLQAFMKEGKISMMPLLATRILYASATVYCGSLILAQGMVANQKLKELGEDYYDAPFYKGKIASARFYVMNVVPEVLAIKAVIEAGDTSAIDIPEEAFQTI